MDAGHKFMIQMTAGELHEVVNLNVLHDDTYGYDLQYGDMSNIDPSSTNISLPPEVFAHLVPMLKITFTISMQHQQRV